ncbi:hypothetical protein RvY_12198 [Ramazzottius varieornatus]|uniref:Uncharacterized protein n=1 Tax=Ramazzottius varieornatus TaxID=947166 RepID=A0A1D1VMW9_RAMVA|nr:hypothetical protein RvY_12198 [Ramazzottius varieornatus]
MITARQCVDNAVQKQELPHINSRNRTRGLMRDSPTTRDTTSGTRVACSRIVQILQAARSRCRLHRLLTHLPPDLLQVPTCESYGWATPYSARNAAD